MTTLFKLQDKALLQCSQRCHEGEFWHVRISARQQSLRCGQNLRGPFLRATLPMTVGLCTRVMAERWEDKGAHNSTIRMSFYTIIYVCVSAHHSWRCSQNVHRSFLRAGRFIIYVTRYIKTDHLQFFSKFAFLVRIDAEFTVEFNGQRARL